MTVRRCPWCNADYSGWMALTNHLPTCYARWAATSAKPPKGEIDDLFDKYFEPEKTDSEGKVTAYCYHKAAKDPLWRAGQHWTYCAKCGAWLDPWSPFRS